MNKTTKIDNHRNSGKKKANLMEQKQQCDDADTVESKVQSSDRISGASVEVVRQGTQQPHDRLTNERNTAHTRFTRQMSTPCRPTTFNVQCVTHKETRLIPEGRRHNGKSLRNLGVGV